MHSCYKPYKKIKGKECMHATNHKKINEKDGIH